jgi:hypothetical protein
MTRSAFENAMVCLVCSLQSAVRGSTTIFLH